MDRHPIQLLNITVEEVFFKKNYQNQEEKYDNEFSLVVSRSEYDAEEKMFSVKLDMIIESEKEGPQRPYDMRISISGHFSVDEDQFPNDQIYKFADHNAPILLIPYIREHAYSMSTRAGVDPIIFPLVQVPTFKLQKNVSSGE